MLRDPSLRYTILAPLSLQSLQKTLPNDELNSFHLNYLYHASFQILFATSTSDSCCFGLEETNYEGVATSTYNHIRLSLVQEHNPYVLCLLVDILFFYYAMN
jgi:hypothetical protein